MRKPVVILCACVAVVALLCRQGTPAEEKQPEDRDWSTCISEGKTTYDMLDRAKEAIASLTLRMNALLDKARAKLDDEGDKLLDRNQADWLAYARSRAAMAADEYRGGTLSGVSGSRKLVDLYIERIRDLKVYEEEIGKP